MHRLAYDREALKKFSETCENAREFWERAPSPDWMLRLLRDRWSDAVPLPEAALRRFALKCAEDVRGSDTPSLRHILTVVEARIDGRASLVDLDAAQAVARGHVTAGGVQGLPRYSPYAAGSLAVWHTANADPIDAASLAADYRARHDAFVAVFEKAATWKPMDRSLWRGGWREAAFARIHPDVYDDALAAARQRLADVLRSFLPRWVGVPVRAEVYGRRAEDSELTALVCGRCVLTVPDAYPLVLFDASENACSICRRPLAARIH